MTRKVITWSVVIAFIYFAAADPAGLGRYLLQDPFNWLRDAGDAMTKWVNSL